jgi:hypothetical protein
MAKTAKKTTKVESKSSSKEKVKPEAKSEKKAVAKKETAPKKDAAAKKETPIEAKKEKPAKKPVNEADQSMEAAAPPVPKIGKREKAARAAIEKTNAEELKKWTDYKQKYGSEKAVPYSMAAVYESGQPLQHKVLGWGYIINVQNDRLEVLFESGPKMLISNYKAS